MKLQEIKHKLQTEFFTKSGRVNPSNKFKHSDFIEKYINPMTDFLNVCDKITLPQRLWHILNEKFNIQLCEGGTKVTFRNYKYGYHKYCSNNNCICQADVRLQKMKTIIERYGVDNPAKSELVKEKSKITIFNKYGVEYISQVEEFKEKSKITIFNKYGVTHQMQSIIVKNKIKTTNIERYGVENVFQLEVIKDKIKATNIERYGVEYTSQVEEFRDKSKATNLERYGFEYSSQSNIVKDKAKENSLIKYGVENVFQLEVIKDKIKATNLEKYGVEHISQLHLIDIMPLIKSQEFWNSFNNYHEILDYFRSRVSESHIYNLIHKYRPDFKFEYNVSYPHRIINNFLTELDIEFEINTREIISPLELDIFIPNHKLAIEINGIYWHTERQDKDETYHLTKVNQCELKGVTLLQFTDYDILNKTDIVFSMIKAELGLNEPIIAEDCNLVDDEIAKIFYNKNHIHGYESAKIHKGLIYNNELVALISLNKLDNEKCDYEVIQFTNKINYNVIDGFSTLIKNLDCKGKLIFSINRNYSNGIFYETNGWNLETILEPNYYYTKDHQNLHHSKEFQKHKLEKLLEVFDDNLTEVENMTINGYDIIWDCGTKVYRYNY